MSSWTYCDLNVPHRSKLYFNLLATVQLNWINQNKLGFNQNPKFNSQNSNIISTLIAIFQSKSQL